MTVSPTDQLWPQFLIVTKLIPALLAGCTVILKPAPESPLKRIVLAEMMVEAELPQGVVSVLPGDASVGESLVEHPGVDKVSFTGSTAAGKAVAAACATDLRRVSLELGGKSAAIVFADADPGTVAVRSASLSNSGQICNALTRILVPLGPTTLPTRWPPRVPVSRRSGSPTCPATSTRLRPSRCSDGSPSGSRSEQRSFPFRPVIHSSWRSRR